MFMRAALKAPTPLVSGVLIMLAGGCSKDAERIPAGETAASTPSATVPETAATQTDSATVVRTESVAAAKPAVPKPQIRPSIDPGRKATPSKPAPPTAAVTTATLSADSTPAAAPAPQQAGQGQWLKYDSGSNTVTFELIAGPFNWNGYASGGATLVLPPKANVVMNFVNKDGTPHSAEIISGEGPIPNAGGDPAIPRAYTNKLIEGLAQEGSDVMRFTVPASGSYRIFCGVPGHGLSGMWIWMKVDPAAKAPSFGPTKG